uniref:histone-lysine N-methyltransferase SUVR4 n=1 Tax=Erigeron canadensis TaxID=72917 RepID=UPI001CB94A7C|nr:histone-lysine N-methyltransferase SUVR4 [Erigeron canadensis]
MAPTKRALKAPDPRPPVQDHQKVSAAYEAMKEIGFPPEKVKPVLKNLLKLYDGRWELIEEDNYQNLADAILTSMDDKGTSTTRDRNVLGSTTSRMNSVIYKKRHQNTELDDDVTPVAKLKRPLTKRENHKKKFHKVEDIAKGTETIRISLIDEVGIELPKFVYIQQNTKYQDAYVSFSLARIAEDGCCIKCKGDCLSSRVPCVCSSETGGEFAYTPEGLLKDKFLDACVSMNHDPENHHLFHCQDCPLERAMNGHNPACKGHLLRKFIKECWRKCGCSMDCGNRVVQRGITCKLQVFSTEAKGWGVRTLECLPKGSFICEYVGEILTNTELWERNRQGPKNERHTYPIYLDADWGSEQVLKDEEALCLDATYYGNVARFINHRCYDSNLIEIPVEVETPDHHYYHVAFFTKREVDACEELTWDYGIDFADEDHPIKAFECHCGAPYCRDVRRIAMNKKVGAGKMTSFWHHIWIDNSSLASEYPCGTTLLSSGIGAGPVEAARGCGSISQLHQLCSKVSQVTTVNSLDTWRWSCGSMNELSEIQGLTFDNNFTWNNQVPKNMNILVCE